MDTDSLLFSFRLDCPPRRVIDRFDKQFELLFPRKVVEEYENNLRSGRLKSYDSVKSDIDLFLDQKIKAGKVVDERVYSNCLKYVKRWFSLIGKQKEYNSLGEGERHCIALGLYMSHRNKKCLVVMTDDLPARDAGIDLFVCRQHIGLISSLLTTMLFIYFVNTDLSDLYIRGLVNDYFNLNPPKSPNVLSFRDNILEDIKFSCREQHFRKCGLSCLTP
jgi:hypothetical protein